MSTGSLINRIARLRREIERLSAKHAENMALTRVSSASETARKLEAKRAEILARRIRQLNEMLDNLQGGGRVTAGSH